MSAPEFSHVVTLTEAGQGRDVELTADEAARARIAKRLDLVELSRFEVTAAVRAVAGGMTVRGEVRATLVQSCAATGEHDAIRVASSTAAPSQSSATAFTSPIS